MTIEHSAEEWRAVAGFPGYEASDLGRVRSWRSRNGRGAAKAPRILSHGTIHGYPVVCMQGGAKGQHTRFVHALVLNAFVGPCPEGMECLHWDGCRENPKLENLRWGTPKENAADKERHGRIARGERHGSATKPHRVPRGDRHGSRIHPDRVARGERHGSKTKPESVLRGDKHWSRKHPKIYNGVRVENLRKALKVVDRRGEKNARAVLSEETAKLIIADLDGGMRPCDAVRKYADQGATESRVSDISTGRCWTHLRRGHATSSGGSLST